MRRSSKGFRLMDDGQWPNTEAWTEGPRGRRSDQGWIAYGTMRSMSAWKWWWGRPWSKSRLGLDQVKGEVSLALGVPSSGEVHGGHASIVKGLCTSYVALEVFFQVWISKPERDLGVAHVEAKTLHEELVVVRCFKGHLDHFAPGDWVVHVFM